MIEGGDGLINRYNGIPGREGNPLRWGFNQLAPIRGDATYDGLNLMASLAALRVQVPLNIGKADGLNRPATLFDVTVLNINNTRLTPFTKQATPYGTHQGVLLYGVGSKGMTVIDDILNAGDKK